MHLVTTCPPFDPATGTHACGHLRDGFIAAVDSFAAWGAYPVEPSIHFGHDRVLVRISVIASFMIPCSDIMPTGLREQLSELARASLPRFASYGIGAIHLCRVIRLKRDAINKAARQAVAA